MSLRVRKALYIMMYIADQMSASIPGVRTWTQIQKTKSGNFSIETYSGKEFSSLTNVYQLFSHDSPEVMSNDNSLLEGENIMETSDTDSDTEPSLSQELSHQKGLASESLWAGHAVQANRSLTAVVTVEQPLVVNVTDGLLKTLHGLVEGKETSATGSELINNLGGEGSILYTEINVARKYVLNRV